MDKLLLSLLLVFFSAASFAQKVVVKTDPNQMDSLRRSRPLNISDDSLRLQKIEGVVDSIKVLTPNGALDLNSPLSNENGILTDLKIQGREEEIKVLEEAWTLKEKMESYKKIQFPELPTEPNGLSSKVLSAVQMEELREVIYQNENFSKISQQGKEAHARVIIENKQKLKERFFLEGVVSWIPDFNRIINVSPALGLNVFEKFSIGAGPNILFGQPDPRIPQPDLPKLSTLGFRPFIKYDLIEQKLFVQAENTVHKRLGIREKSTLTENPSALFHQVAIGAGYLLKLSSNSGLNFMALYQIGDRSLSDSPIIIRVGLSSLQNNKK
ncbi:hypothetical protein [Litoribacter populi]|uniref:hypothetical protein n=1 Tax=Litoribacter populi TaxID=2598460 RepID=UPI00117D369C|nr:hypothetical protein [Litoribacter populi]